MKEYIAENVSDLVIDEPTRFERCNIRHCTFNVKCHFDRCNIIECEKQKTVNAISLILLSMKTTHSVKNKFQCNANYKLLFI